MRAWVLACLGVCLCAAGARAEDAGPACGTPDPRSPDAEWCAQRALDAARAAARDFDDLAIVVTPPGVYPRTSVHALVEQVREASDRAQRLAHGFDAVMSWGRPAHTIAALVAQGQLYEHLAHALVSVGVGSDEFSARLHGAMEPQVQPLECRAIVRYLSATRAARAASLHVPEAQTALERLQSYDPPELTTCAHEQERRDSTFAALSPTDLAPLP